jgi:DNA invertase Pin-like site-specific DNA recombinase
VLLLDVLVIAKLDPSQAVRLAQGAQVMDRAKRKGWSLVASRLRLDTTTPAGEMVANVILSTAQYMSAGLSGSAPRTRSRQSGSRVSVWEASDAA